jgi:hypothetical protein
VLFSRDTLSRDWFPPRLHEPVIRLRALVLVAICVSQSVGLIELAAADPPAPDPLVISFEHPSRVFATNEVVRLTAAVTSRKAGDGRDRGIPRLEWQFVPIGGAKPVDAGDVRFEPAGSGQATDVALELTMPAEEGAYTLRLATH